MNIVLGAKCFFSRKLLTTYKCVVCLLQIISSKLFNFDRENGIHFVPGLACIRCHMLGWGGLPKLFLIMGAAGWWCFEIVSHFSRPEPWMPKILGNISPGKKKRQKVRKGAP